MSDTVYALLFLAAFGLACLGFWIDIQRQCDKAQREDELDAIWGTMTEPLKLEYVPFGRLGDPREHPRWDGTRIRRYDEETDEEKWYRAYAEAVCWRDWQTCEILIDERKTADWYVSAETT